MKKLLIPCAFALLAATSASAADRQMVEQAVGQPVYDTTDLQVGVIKGATNETGEPSAIIATNSGFGGKQVLISDQSLQPRSAGGWLAALDNNSISQLQPYVPGQMPPA